MVEMSGLFERKILAQSILQQKGYVPAYQSKKLAIRGGRAVLVPVRKYGYYLDTDPRADPSKKHQILACKLSERGQEAVMFDQSLGPELIKTLLAMYANQYNWVNAHEIRRVPEDTGRLRRSLLRAMTMHKRFIEDLGYVVMEIGSGIPYLIYVNEMETYPKKGEGGVMEGPHLRHPPYVGNYKVGKAGTHLYDPSALKHFFGWVVLNARNHANKAINEAITALYYRKRAQFGWTHRSHAARYFKWRNSGARRGWSFN